jgi:hypothetical protein
MFCKADQVLPCTIWGVIAQSEILASASVFIFTIDQSSAHGTQAPMQSGKGLLTLATPFCFSLSD